jgi:hypothetical protein
LNSRIISEGYRLALPFGSSLNIFIQIVNEYLTSGFSPNKANIPRHDYGPPKTLPIPDYETPSLLPARQENSKATSVPSKPRLRGAMPSTRPSKLHVSISMLSASIWQTTIGR